MSRALRSSHPALSLRSHSVLRTLSNLLLACWLAAGTCAAMADVLATQKPLTLLVKELAGGAVDPLQLIPDGVSPHEFSLNWSGRRQLNDAELVVWGGAELEPQLAAVMADLPAGQVFDASVVGLRWVTAADCHGHDRGEDHSQRERHDHHHGHSADEHSPSCRDPHFWFNPENMVLVAEALLRRLVAIDALSPTVAEQQRQAFVARLEAADERARQLLEPLRDRYYVVEHDAYNHFTRHYGLTQPGFLRVGHGTPLGPRSLARLMGRDDIACVFTEPEYPPDLASRLASRTGAQLVELDPLGSQVRLDQGYTGFLAAFVDAVAGCLATDS